jgi:hypothetical protein
MLSLLGNKLILAGLTLQSGLLWRCAGEGNTVLTYLLPCGR